MKESKRDGTAINQQVETVYFNDEAIFMVKSDGKKRKEKFDKNSLSEDDLDRIQGQALY